MDISKILIAVGLFFLILGLGWSLGLGRLPGDIVVRRDNFTFYAPVASSILISLLLSIVLLLMWRR
jgi:hypothetical protein